MKENKAVQEAIEDAVILIVHGREEEGRKIANANSILAYPSFVIMDSQGQTLQTIIGFSDPQVWLDRVAVSVADPIPLEQREQRFGEQPTYADAMILGQTAYAQGRFQPAVDFYRKAEVLDPQAAVDDRLPITMFRALSWGMQKDIFSNGEITGAARSVLMAENATAKDVYAITGMLGGLISKVGARNIAPLLELAASKVEDHTDGDHERSYQNLDILLALHVQKNPDLAVEKKIATLPEGWQDNSDELGSFAWWCFEQDVNLEQAQLMAQKSVELTEDDNQKANALDTVAELKAKGGDLQGAVEASAQAAKLSPNSEYLSKQAERFRKLLEEQ